MYSKPYFSVTGLKPRMRDHYRAQKMALWLNLIPDLQKAATSNHMRPHQQTPAEVNNGEGLLGMEDRAEQSEVISVTTCIQNAFD